MPDDKIFNPCSFCGSTNARVFVVIGARQYEGQSHTTMLAVCRSREAAQQAIDSGTLVEPGCYDAFEIEEEDVIGS